MRKPRSDPPLPCLSNRAAAMRARGVRAASAWTAARAAGGMAAPDASQRGGAGECVVHHMRQASASALNPPGCWRPAVRAAEVSTSSGRSTRSMWRPSLTTSSRSRNSLQQGRLSMVGRRVIPVCPTHSLLCLVLRSLEILCGTSDLVVLEALRKVVQSWRRCGLACKGRESPPCAACFGRVAGRESDKSKNRGTRPCDCRPRLILG